MVLTWLIYVNFSAALGGSDQEDRICFLSSETVHSIIVFILKNLASVLIASNFEWARFAYDLLSPAEDMHLKVPEKHSMSVNFGMAHFAFGVLKGSLSSLVLLEEDSVFPSILAALFIIEWECSMALILGEADLVSHKDDSDVDASDEEIHLKANLAESINTFCQSLSSSFWNNLHSCTLNKLIYILAQAVRFAVFHTKELHDDITAVLCSEWVVDMLKLICINHITLQSFFDLLLSEGECWPLWLAPSLQNGHPSMEVRFEPAITDEIVRICPLPSITVHAPVYNKQCATYTFDMMLLVTKFQHTKQFSVVCQYLSSKQFILFIRCSVNCLRFLFGSL
jgi:E3 ubiquitin-protein ligase listerin